MRDDVYLARLLADHMHQRARQSAGHLRGRVVSGGGGNGVASVQLANGAVVKAAGLEEFGESQDLTLRQAFGHNRSGYEIAHNSPFIGGA